MKIPSWHECLKVPKKDRNPLEVFILNNEPGGSKEEKQFRSEVSNLIEWLLSLESDELGYLKWFVKNCNFGPAHEDVIEIMQNQYEKETGLKVPEGWR